MWEPSIMQPIRRVISSTPMNMPYSGYDMLVENTTITY